MAVKIRLQRHGKKKAPLFTIVVANSRSPRDGRYIERLGTYDPTTIPATISIDNDKAIDWMSKGAQPTDTVKRILSYKGVLYKKHLDRGVKMNVLTQEKADQLYKDFIEQREDQVRRHREAKLNKDKKAKEALLANEVKRREAMEAARKPKVEEAPAEVAAVAVEEEAPAAATAAPEAPAAASPVAEAPPAEAPAAEAPKAEVPAEEPAAEAPAPEEQSPESPSEEQPK